MIRFVDLRGAEIDYNFAFWDTVCDRFLMFNDKQAWACINTFMEDTMAGISLYARERLLRLMPKGVPQTTEEAEEQCEKEVGSITQEWISCPEINHLNTEAARRMAEDNHEKEKPKLCVDCRFFEEATQVYDPPPPFGCKRGSRNSLIDGSPMVYRDCVDERTAEGDCGLGARNFEPKGA